MLCTFRTWVQKRFQVFQLLLNAFQSKYSDNIGKYFKVLKYTPMHLAQVLENSI